MRSFILNCLAFLLLISLSACAEQKKQDENYKQKPEMATEKASSEDPVTRGEYLVRTIGCDHCHSPKKMTPDGPVPDMTLWLSGYPEDRPLPAGDLTKGGPEGWGKFNQDLTAFVGPWGMTFGSNLTPDDTGLGSWSFEQFKRAMTQGKYKGLENSRPLMPPMPWQSYIEMKEEDLKAIFAYLQSIEPVENVVPSYRPPVAAAN